VLNGVESQGERTGDDDPAGAGLRRQPELDEVRPVETRLPLADEFADDTLDEADDEAVRRRGLDRAMRRVARQAALDPGDGML